MDTHTGCDSHHAWSFDLPASKIVDSETENIAAIKQSTAGGSSSTIAEFLGWFYVRTHVRAYTHVVNGLRMVGQTGAVTVQMFRGWLPTGQPVLTAEKNGLMNHRQPGARLMPARFSFASPTNHRLPGRAQTVVGERRKWEFKTVLRL